MSTEAVIQNEVKNFIPKKRRVIPPPITNRVAEVLPDLGGITGGEVGGVEEGVLVGSGEGEGVGEAEISDVDVGEGTIVNVGVRLADGVASPKTNPSPLLRTTNFLLKLTGFPRLSNPSTKMV